MTGATRRGVSAQGGSSESFRDGRRSVEHGATQGDTCALLRRLAELSAEHAEVLEDLAEVLQNRLAVSPRTSVMDTTAMRPREPQSEAPRDPLWSVADVAERIGVDQKTVRRWRTDGELPPAFNTGSVVRWERSAIESWITERTEAEK